MPRWKFIALNTYITTEERYKINNITFHLRKSEKEQTKFKVSRRKEIKISRAEINETEHRKSIEKTNQPNLLF